MNAQQAIDAINSKHCLMPQEELHEHLKVITQAYVMGAQDAARWLWLLNWKPPQLVN